MRILYSWLALASLLTLLGCTQKQTSRDVKEQTAQATAELKDDAKAVVAGVQEGWSRDKPLNLNTASKDDLMALPGITAARADAVMNARPYDDPAQLLSRHILPQQEYDKIADRLTAEK
jgi:DNA uptake protein ComE-like DNA-binding protein